MEKFVIRGGNPLHGEVTVSGAKNAALAIIPAAILSQDICRIENLPVSISDVSYMMKTLRHIGAQVKLINANSIEIDAYNKLGTAASHGCVRLAAIDAKYIYDHIPSGSKVEIFVGTQADDPLGVPERPYVGEWDKYYDPTDPEYQPE